MDGLPTIETARRLLRSQLDAAAKEQRRRWEKAQEAPRDWPTVLAAWEAEHPPEEVPYPGLPLDATDEDVVRINLEYSADLERARDRREAAIEDVRAQWQREVWLAGSGKQLQRHWGGRCISCVHWDPDGSTLAPSSGECGVLHLDETNPLINVVQNTPRAAVTTAAFGCICWGEIPADDAETLRARAELAIALGMLPRMPEGA